MAEEKTNKDYFVGVDFGGTKILAGVFNRQLECIGKDKKSTKSHRGTEAVIERIARTIREAVDESELKLDQVAAIGIGAPGAVDPEKGMVINGPNLGWQNVPLRKELEKMLGIPVFLENDCNACTIGVHEVELGGQAKNLVGIFLGTGIGAGMILGGKLYSGYNRTAGEIGHMIMGVNMESPDKNPPVTIEQLASRTAIFRRIKSEVAAGKKTVLTDSLGPEVKDMRSGDLRKALKKGDKLVERVIRDAAVFAGMATANIINLLNPEVIVLGGGIIEALENHMLPLIIQTAEANSLPGTAKGIKIIASRLADDAGITGAAALALRESRK